MWWVLWQLVRVVLWICLGLFAWHLVVSGIFQFKVKVTEKRVPEMRVAYRALVGPYKNSGAHFDHMLKLVRSCGVKKPEWTLGVYYDNPREVPDAECRYAVAYVLQQDKKELVPRHVQKDVMEGLASAGYVLRDLPSAPALTARFPFKGVVSIILAIVRVYPALDKYASRKGLQVGYVMEHTCLRKEFNDYYVPLPSAKDAAAFQMCPPRAGDTRRNGPSSPTQAGAAGAVGNPTGRKAGKQR